MHAQIDENGKCTQMHVLAPTSDVPANFIETDQPRIGQVWNGVSWAPPSTWLISRLAFKRRFPPAKWKACRVAAKTDDALADFFESWQMASRIDLQDTELVAAVTSMTGGAVPVGRRLTQAEADAVLLVPAAPRELP